MADCAGDDLLHERPAASQAGCIIIRGEIADERGDTVWVPNPIAELRSRARQKSYFCSALPGTAQTI
jgi:hypothetical protein